MKQICSHIKMTLRKYFKKSVNINYSKQIDKRLKFTLTTKSNGEKNYLKTMKNNLWKYNVHLNCDS